MIKYIKWVLLVILIVSWVFFCIKLVNYDGFKIQEIYEYDWFLSEIYIYEDDVLVTSNDSLVNDSYIIFSKDNVSYCDSYNNTCDKYTYKYNKGKINVDGNDDFLLNGEYDIELDNNKLVLKNIKGNTEIVYNFICLLN